MVPQLFAALAISNSYDTPESRVFFIVTAAAATTATATTATGCIAHEFHTSTTTPTIFVPAITIIIATTTTAAAICVFARAYVSGAAFESHVSRLGLVYHVAPIADAAVAPRRLG